MADAPSIRTRPACTGRLYGIGVLPIAVAGYAAWLGLTGDGIDGALLLAAVVLAAIGGLFAAVAWHCDGLGVVLGPAGFRPRPRSDWVPWYRLHALGFHAVRQCVTLHDADGRTLGAPPYDTPDLVSAVGRLIEARPELGAGLPLPVTLRASPTVYVTWALWAVILAFPLWFAGAASSDPRGELRRAVVFAVIGLMMLAVGWEFARSLRRTVVRTTVEPDGITVPSYPRPPYP